MRIGCDLVYAFLQISLFGVGKEGSSSLKLNSKTAQRAMTTDLHSLRCVNPYFYTTRSYSGTINSLPCCGAKLLLQKHNKS